MRVHELAKKLNITSKELLAKLKDRQIEAKNHMTNLDEDVVKLFLEAKASSSKKSEVTTAAPVKPSRKFVAKKAPEVKEAPGAPGAAKTESPLAPPSAVAHEA